MNSLRRMTICIAAAALVAPAQCYYIETLCMAQVAKNEWHPIRIAYEINGAENVSADQLSFVRTALDKAIAYWSQSLSVRSSTVFETLSYERPCGASMGSLCMSPGSIDGNVDFPYENEVLNAMAGQSINNYQCAAVGGFKVDPLDVDGLDIYGCGAETESGDLSDDSVVANESLVTHHGGCELVRSIPPMPGSGKLVGMDLFLNIELKPLLDEGYIAVATTCGEDECGRPTVGGIGLGRGFFVMEPYPDSAVVILIHEMSHVFGFNTNAFQKWIDPGSGNLLVQPKDWGLIMGWVEYGEQSGLVESIKLTSSFRDGETYFERVNIPYHVVGLMNHPLRNVDQSECHCPTTVDDKFTESDLIDCANNSASTCLFGIKANRVREEAVAYYGCDRLEGMELEDSDPGSMRYLNSHWRTRNMNPELMNPAVAANDILFVSPMTGAVMEGSGWYVLDKHHALTALYPGIHWGHLDGCDLLERALTNPRNLLLLPYTNKEFSGQSLLYSKNARSPQPPSTMCSSSGLSYFSIIRTTTTPDYREETASDYFRREFCAKADNDYQHRCVDTIYTIAGTEHSVRRPICSRVVCSRDGEHTTLSYSVAIDTNWTILCEERDQLVVAGPWTVSCAAPSTICAKLYYPHYGYGSGINRVPGDEKTESALPSGQSALVSTNDNKESG